MTDDGKLHQISAEIGGLKSSIDLMREMWKAQEASAGLGRKSLHEKFDILKVDVGLQISGLSLRIDRVVDQMKAVTDKVSMIEPSITSINNEKLRDEGARRSGKKWWYWILTAAGFFGWGIHELVTWLKH